MFSTPIAEPRAGKPRMFPLLAVYEAAMLSWGAQRGILHLIRGAWSWRQTDSALADSGEAAAIIDHALADAATAGRLSEFVALPASDDIFWAVYLEPAEQQAAGGTEIGTWTEIGRKLFSKDREGALVLNVSALVRNVNRRLAEAGYPVDGSGESV
jgi:hypothetical protein